MDSVLQYEVHITDSMQFYDIYIHVRNTTDFETQNFYVFLTTEYPNGFTGKDTLGCILCDARGQWTGKGSGRVKENRFVYKRNVRFPLTGIYKFTAVQGMRDKQVKGIADFGMSLYKIKKNK
jgi:gliding motility-associated lipoprotein GldH